MKTVRPTKGKIIADLGTTTNAVAIAADVATTTHAAHVATITRVLHGNVPTTAHAKLARPSHSPSGRKSSLSSLERNRLLQLPARRQHDPIILLTTAAKMDALPITIVGRKPGRLVNSAKTVPPTNLPKNANPALLVKKEHLAPSKSLK